jgi:hypothetical protein
VVLEHKVATTPQGLQAAFAVMPRSRVALEKTGMHSPWPTFHGCVKPQVANQVAAPAETRTLNWHRENNRSSRVRMEGWRQRY